jgi:hypothetical protein
LRASSLQPIIDIDDEACLPDRIYLSAVLLVATCAWAADQSAEPKVKVGDDTFKCITDMTPVRHFYVDNLLGNLQGTVAVAEKGRGDYPEARSYNWSRLK